MRAAWSGPARARLRGRTKPRGGLPMQLLRLCVLGAVMMFAACATAPKTASERASLEQSAMTTLQQLRQADPGLNNLLQTAPGYAVFPEIGKGGLIAGAAYGRGVLFENGQMTGYVEMNQGSLGAQIGAQTFAELIVFRDRAEIERLKRG